MTNGSVHGWMMLKEESVNYMIILCDPDTTEMTKFMAILRTTGSPTLTDTQKVMVTLWEVDSHTTLGTTMTRRHETGAKETGGRVTTSTNIASIGVIESISIKAVQVDGGGNLVEKAVDNSVEEHVEIQPRSPDDRVFEHDTPKDPNFWHKEAATTTWNYVQSGTTIRYDDAAGPSTRRGDRELDMERARNILEECIEPTDNGSQQTTQQHGQRQQIDQPPPKAPKGKNTVRKRHSKDTGLCCTLL
ncbi:hypothetical protein F4801DRAFT_573777 [Xylaria longipes]|nr:hypothetical protein F4801DRAFT_573777 [Xylaria longipes]